MLRRLSEGLAGAFDNGFKFVLVAGPGQEPRRQEGGEGRREVRQRAGKEAVDAD
jgi:hypothetical protein